MAGSPLSDAQPVNDAQPARRDLSTDRKHPNPGLVDRHVGARVRERRLLLGMSQQQLADAIGVTYQQAHKYERGLNRISAGRLFAMAQALAVPVSWFFEGIGRDRDAVQLSRRQRLSLEMARTFAQITNERHRLALSQMARALAGQEGAGLE